MKYTLDYYDTGAWKWKRVGHWERGPESDMADLIDLARQVSLNPQNGRLICLIPEADGSKSVYFHNGVELIPRMYINEDAAKFLEGIDPALIRKVVSRGQNLLGLLTAMIDQVDHYLDANWVEECVPEDLIEMAGGQAAFDFPLGTEAIQQFDDEEDEDDTAPEYDDYHYD